jgi:tyrosyl-DNA phosphodiesterase-1
VRIASYEMGVLVWPGLFGENATMVPTFKTDTPSTIETEAEQIEEKEKGLVVGARMPYDLPLVSYTRNDEPWCATKSYNEPDWNGEVYTIMQRH